jgi:3-oxoacyl-[acyl-carrier protein] reductase
VLPRSGHSGAPSAAGLYRQHKITILHILTIRDLKKVSNNDPNGKILEEMVMRLHGKICLVTGGASGIGAAICLAFANEGATVVVVDLNLGQAQALAGTFPKAVALQCDVSAPEQVDEAFASVVEKFGRLDVVVNNAGILGAEEYAEVQKIRDLQLEQAVRGEPKSPLRATVKLTNRQWQAMIDTHLNGTFFCTRAALRIMEVQASGSIINMSSINGIQGGLGNPHYSAAKAGILGFTRAVAKEVIGQGIRVNAIAPGFVDTPLRDSISKGLQRAQIEATPIGRPATAAEIAATAVFLASDEASYYAGATMSINGGYLTV